MAKGARTPLASIGAQTNEERRQLRGHYRQLHQQCLAGKENLVNGGSDLQDLLAKADALHSKAEKPREHAVDAEVFAQLAQCGLAMIKQGQALNQGRLPSDLIAALRNTFLNDPMSDNYEPGPHDFDWAALGAAVGGLHRTVPGVSCLLGPLEAQAKARKVVVRRARQAVEELTRPEELQEIQEAGDKQETDRNYENMWRQLRNVVGYGQTVPFINLVCNHKSFAQTVENIFTLSFLVRDGRVRLVCDPAAGVLVVPVTEKQKAAAAQQGESKALQFMLSFGMNEWADMKMLVPADACVMPHRGTTAAAAAGGRAAAGQRRGDAAAKQDQQQAKRARRG